MLNKLGRGPNTVVVLLAASRKKDIDQTLNNFSIGSKDDIAGLRPLILDEYRESRRERTHHPMMEPAALAVAEKPDVTAIVKFLAKDQAVATRIVAVWSLRHVGTPEAVAGLITALKDKDKLVRYHAVRALDRVGCGVEGVEDAVRAMLRDRAKDVRTAAEAAMKQLNTQRA